MKNQIKDILKDRQGQARQCLIEEYNRVSLALENDLRQLEAELLCTPRDVYEMVAQRERLEGMEKLVADMQ